MLTIDYLKKVLAGYVAADGHTIDTDKEIIDAPDIMEGLTQLAQVKGYPFAILFEEAFHYDDDDRNDVPVTRFEQSIYVMRMARADTGNRTEELQCFEDVKRIRAILLAHQGAHDPEMEGWDRTARRDFVSGAANYVGWKIRLRFVDYEDWSWELGGKS